MEWMDSLKKAIDYMEQNLLQNIGACDVAEAVHMSPYYFQKGFKIMTGYTVGEYIRNRRLYLAAIELASGNDKLIEISYKYGYETPESFTKAFYRFHGVNPSRMRGDTSKIRTFLPLRISIEIKGGHDMDYVIEKLDGMTLIGFERVISYENNYEAVPKFWDDFSERKCHDTKDEKINEAVVRVAKECRVGEYGVCIDDLPGKEGFRYMIAGIYDGGEVPEGMKLYEIPAMEWAKFRCVGALPGALQSVNTRIYKEWIPGNEEYEMAADVDIEWYSAGDMSSSDYVSEIWIPVKKR